jgi:hypothetical protein
MRRFGERLIPTKRSRRQPFCRRYRNLVGRWLIVRSDDPEIDVVTVLCKARGYIARQEVRQTKVPRKASVSTKTK